MSPIKLYKPTTPARRRTSVSVAPTGEPHKPLIKGKPSRAGRSRGDGRITVRHRGGGAKRAYRTVDFRQDKEVSATVESLSYDPFRTAFIALLKYADGDRRYVLAEARLKVDQKIDVGAKAAIKRGNRVPLKRIPTGTAVFNVQSNPGSDGTIVRAAGSAATVTAQDAGMTQLKLPSGEVRRLPGESLATIGAASNPDHFNVRVGKAGRSRHRGWRPTVRGKAMNPVDHPHGGGEGGSPIGLPGPKTPSGLFTLGRKTRRKRKPARSVVRAR